MSNQIKIICLPADHISNPNPYQFLMIKGLKKNKALEVKIGCASKRYGIILSAFYFRPKYLHFDWITEYYLRKDIATSWFRAYWFLFQIIIAKKLFRIRIVWTQHNILPHDSRRKNIHEWVQYKFYKYCDWIRVFSESTAKTLVLDHNYSIKKILIVPEGSYLGYYNNTINKYDARCKLKLKTDEKIFLFFGAIKPYKGIEELVNIFNENKFKKVRLVISGRTPDKKYARKIQKLVRNNRSITLFDRYIENKEIELFFNSSDFCILPFKKIENSGSVILAMGFKKVVIAPNIGVIPDRLKNQREFLYNDNLLDKINLALSKAPHEIVGIGQKNYQELKKHSWEDYSSCFME